MDQKPVTTGQSPDEATFSGRIGLLVPSSNSTVEPEFYRALPAAVTLHATRLFLQRIAPDSIATLLSELDRAASLLATADVDVIILAATAPSFLKGKGYDLEIIDRITAATGKPATTTSTAMLRALSVLGAERVGLGSAYDTTVNDLATAFLEANGYSVVAKEGLGLVDNLEVGRLGAQTAFDVGLRVARSDAQVILLACTNWPSMAIVDRLEEATGKPVITTSQVSVWDGLRHIGHDRPVLGYGKLLRDMMAAGEGRVAAAHRTSA